MSLVRRKIDSVDKELIQFIKNNLGSFSIDARSSEVTVCISDFRKPMFHSGDRPCTSVLLKYRDLTNRMINKNIWIKKVKQPQQAFNRMIDVYKRLESCGISTHMPVPFCFDKRSGFIFLNQVFGESLSVITCLQVLSRFKCLPGWLDKTYYDIGKWLSKYHLVMTIPRKTPFTNMLNELRSALRDDMYFQTHEKQILQKHLTRVQEEIGSDYNMRLTRPHNDFSLRNIIIGEDGNFTVIDWDTMIDPQFPQIAPFWNDLTCFVINVQSLQRFHPLVSRRKIKTLIKSFLAGYFEETSPDITPKMEDVLWVFMLYYFIGLIGDRPLYEIYGKRLSFRFTKILRKKLLCGVADVT